MFDEWVGKLGWKGILDLPFIALSNGQTMRVRIAGTVMKALEVLLLDEPSSECFCLMFFAFFFLPLLSNCCPFMPYTNFLPSFCFLVPPLLFLPRLFSACLSFRLVSPPPCAFPFIAYVFIHASYQSLRPFFTFPCSHLFPQIFLRVSASSVHFCPSPSPP